MKREVYILYANGTNDKAAGNLLDPHIVGELSALLASTYTRTDRA
jgi:hypothetical protein